jgi:hypothetical protein
MIVQGDNRHGPPASPAGPTPVLQLAPAVINMQYKNNTEQLDLFPDRSKRGSNSEHPTNGEGSDHPVRVTFHHDGGASLRISSEFLAWAQSHGRRRADIERALKKSFRRGWPRTHRPLVAIGREVRY